MDFLYLTRFLNFQTTIFLFYQIHPAACKYVNETNHVENDYIFQLDPFKYFSIPKFYMDQLEEFVNSNINEHEIKGDLSHNA